MNTRKLTVIFVVVCFSLLGLSSTAAAQNNDDVDGDPMGGLISTTTTGATTAAIAGGVALTVMLVQGGDESAAVEDYIKDNAVAVQHDLHIGGGDSAEDLATIFGVSEEHTDEFAAVLHENRQALAPLAQPEEISQESAEAFTHIVFDAMQQNDELAAGLAHREG